jgi:hypothetical protein
MTLSVFSMHWPRLFNLTKSYSPLSTHMINVLLVADAIKRVLSISNEIAIYALVVDALNEGAGRFYQQFGFLHLEVLAMRQHPG